MPLPSLTEFPGLTVIEQLTAIYEAVLQGNDFNPEQLPNLHAWYKDAGIESFSSDVTAWNDSSGNDITLSKIEGSLVLENASLNGYDTVRFVASDDTNGGLLGADLGLTSSAATIFIVAKKDPAFLESGWYNFQNVTPNRHPDSSLEIKDSFLSDAQKACGEQVVPMANNWRILSIRSQNGSYKMELDGMDQFSTSTNTFALGGDFWLGRGGDHGDGDNSAFQGEIAEVIIYSAFLTDGQRDSVLNYLRARFAL